jgi:protein arginine kinase
VRLSRNLAGYPFRPTPQSDEYTAALDLISAEVRRVLAERDVEPLVLKSGGMDGRLRRFLSDRGFAGSRAPQEIVFDKNEEIAFLIGGTDHLRIVSTRSGHVLKRVHEDALRWDKALERTLPLAVAMDFGYLATRIAEAGTAMRASLLLHLPALTEHDQITHLLEMAPRAGVRMVSVGHPSAALYLVQNDQSIGMDENTILSKLEESTDSLISYEREARVEWLASDSSSLTKRVDAALASLLRPDAKTEHEAMGLVNDLRVGVLCGLAKGVSLETLNALFFLAQESHIYVECNGKKEGENDIDMARGNLIAKALESGPGSRGELGGITDV